MNRQEVAALLAYAVRLDPRSAPTDQQAAADTLDQWADLLADVPSTAPHPAGRNWDAAQVVRHHIATSPYPIKPSDVSRPWHTFKADVLGRHTDPTPAVDPDNVAAWRAELVGIRQAVATGAALASTHRELTSGEPAPAVEPYVAAVGRRIPSEAAAQLAQYRPRRTQREQLVAAGRPDPYAVGCDYCRARVDKPCHTGRGADRSTPHPSRFDKAAARPARQEQHA
ncbi:zinc finger domain-containing protein [Streptomyces iconiensis]|uniref:Cell surface glycoprotein n=1 Tax=Streptomyces iconiensis TaxID=1384038 RepID=A0ABT7A5A9_9ACTN|nr:cell surface glycoprotein [Streptomyces iconiensis]MDJ1136242.1 cell surface glycoprotein [Streptomyces iconiensis]